MQALSFKKLISPKCLAQAIGVSESSLKRWADQGLLSVTRTAGGHRRISIGEAVTFIRSRKLQLVNPSAIGLSQQSIATNLSPAELDDLFLEHLVHARLQDAWDLLMSKFLQGMSIAEVGDGPMKSALRSLGSQWDHDPKGILIEHRATDLCIQLVQQMRVLATSATPSFRSTGAAISNDPYVLPSLLAASVIAEHGGDVTKFGASHANRGDSIG